LTVGVPAGAAGGVRVSPAIAAPPVNVVAARTAARAKSWRRLGSLACARASGAIFSPPTLHARRRNADAATGGHTITVRLASRTRISGRA